jgi:ArsR family transcriptional regulator
MHTAEIDNIAGLLKAMAHPIRLKILCLLREKEMSVGDLQATIQTTNGNISQHLTILRHQEIITCRKDANFIYNRIADPRVMQLMECLQTLFCCAADNDSSEEQQ